MSGVFNNDNCIICIKDDDIIDSVQVELYGYNIKLCSKQLLNSKSNYTRSTGAYYCVLHIWTSIMPILS